MTSKAYKRIEDYGIIGNLDTAALVGKDGSIDWCCFPHIESPSVFAAILDIDKGGHFAVRPVDAFQSEQGYLGETNVLQTTFRTKNGVVIVTDFMPLKGWDKEDELSHQAIYRKAECVEGSVEIALDYKPRFNYARSKTSLTAHDMAVRAVGPGESTYLSCTFDIKVRDDTATGSTVLNAGDSAWIILQYGHDVVSNVDACETLLGRTTSFWLDWRHQCERKTCVFDGPWHDLIVRSGLALKLLTHQETGAIAAALTTSLPEEIGGVRNWDYRFNWIRDAAFAVQALYNLGHVNEAKKHLQWFIGLCAGTKDPSEIQILYGLHGETDLAEEELDNLSGYKNSRPVRIGNGAVNQKQLDIYGQMIEAIFVTSDYGENITEEVWRFVENTVDYVAKIWQTADAGIWESRGEPRQYVYSKLMCWTAVDRGIKIAEQRGITAQLNKWRRIAEEIRAAVLERGFNKSLNCFTQTFDSEELDATSLLIPMMGFIPFDDPRVQGTINAVIEKLTTAEGLVYRYQSEDGLPGKEGAFTLCSFWLVNALALSGRADEAEEIFKKVIELIGPAGLLSEEADPETRIQLGNVPQAFSHIGLINSALYLGRARGKKQMGPEPLGGRR